MTWVITRLCRDCVDMSCVDVCPVDCIPKDPDYPEDRGALMNKYLSLTSAASGSDVT